MLFSFEKKYTCRSFKLQEETSRRLVLAMKMFHPAELPQANLKEVETAEP